MPGIEFTHANKAEISEVRMTVGIPHSQVVKLLEIARAIERNPYRPALKHGKNLNAGVKVKSRLCQYSLTS